MPANYGDTLTPEQLQQLVRYLLDSAAAGPVTPPAADHPTPPHGLVRRTGLLRRVGLALGASGWGSEPSRRQVCSRPQALHAPMASSTAAITTAGQPADQHRGGDHERAGGDEHDQHAEGVGLAAEGVSGRAIGLHAAILPAGPCEAHDAQVRIDALFATRAPWLLRQAVRVRLPSFVANDGPGEVRKVST